MNAHMDSCATNLFSLYLFSVDDKFMSVYLDHLANLLAFVVSSENLNFNILLMGIDLALYFCLSIFGKRGRRDLPLNVRRCTEIMFAVLASIRSHRGTELHFGGCWSRNGRYRLSRTIWGLQEVQNFGIRRNQEEREILWVRDCIAICFYHRCDEAGTWQMNAFIHAVWLRKTWPLTKVKLMAPPAAALWRKRIEVTFFPSVLWDYWLGNWINEHCLEYFLLLNPGKSAISHDFSPSCSWQ